MSKCICLFLSSFLLVFKLCAATPKEEPFIVGTSSGYAPFVSLNVKEEYEGFDIDVGKEIAKRLNRPFILKDYGNMPGLMLALEQNRVNVIMWGITITEQRRKNIALIYYQGEKLEQIPLIFWKEIPQGIQSLTDLGKDPKNTICVEAGSYQEEILKSAVPSASLKYLNTVTDVLLDLRYKRSVASAIDSALIPRLTQKYPELQVKYLPLPPEQRSFGFGIGVNKANRTLIDKVEQVVTDLMAEGKIAELEKKWGLQ